MYLAVGRALEEQGLLSALENGGGYGGDAVTPDLGASNMAPIERDEDFVPFGGQRVM